ncbi:hypothetical protein [Paeniglutamicibacter sp. NPDC091659]|uniref:hypothetical protein n=1 Tax=Paeniglutamicibacter sp. NPDC091659 TaxID=3364389 RepID=UPI003823A33E
MPVLSMPVKVRVHALGISPTMMQARSCPVDSFTRIAEYYESSGQVLEECIEDD